LMSLKHTNFPDASVCAFTPEHWPWPNADGLLGLVDIYVLWAVRKLAATIREGVVVTVFPDSGDRYLSTGLYGRKK